MACLHSRLISVVLLTLIVLVLLPGPVTADFTFGERVNVGPMVNSPTWDGGPCISPDGLELYLYSFLEGWAVMTLRMATRETTEDAWGAAVALEPPFKGHAAPSFSADGLSLYFEGPGSGGSDIWTTTRSTVFDPWDDPVNLGSLVNSSAPDMGASVSADGLELYFGSLRAGGSGDWDVWVSKRAATSDPWAEAMNLGPAINSPTFDGHPCISPDGLMLLISSDRPGGYGDWDIWVARRAARDADWGPPVNMGPSLNTEAGEAEPYFSADGRTLYFSDWWVPQPGGVGSNDIWQIPVLPIVDFNGDGKVDGVEVSAMVDRWGTNDLLCDIGPMPWGDGSVDVLDLIVLAEYIGEEVDDPDLIAHWALDETEGDMAYDSSGANDAMVAGGGTWQPQGGAVSGALALNGVDVYVETPPVVNPADGPFSVLAWIKGDTPGQVIVSQAGGNDWLLTDANGALITNLKGSGRKAVSLYSQTVVTDGQWHRVGLVWDGVSRMLYIDGVLVADDVPSLLPDISAGLHIGAGANLEAGSFFSGLIDDVRIYNRAVRP